MTSLGPSTQMMQFACIRSDGRLDKSKNEVQMERTSKDGEDLHTGRILEVWQEHRGWWVKLAPSGTISPVMLQQSIPDKFQQVAALE